MLISSNYSKLIFTLTKTISVKLHTVAVSMNIALSDRYNTNKLLYDPQDKTTWIYYLNLSGLRHKTLNGDYTQSVMKIQLLETNEEVELTNDVLISNPLTFLEMKKFSRYYKEVVSRYPDQELLIKGIMFPIDILKSINADDGAILNYDKDLVEYNEISIMTKLEKEIQNYLVRWDIPNYIIIDDLYASALNMGLTKLIILKLHLLRLNNVGTHEVHSYHMNEFFKSNLAIGEYVYVLSKTTKMWLYKNLTFLGTNIGKEKTLESLIDNILMPNSISAKEIKIMQGEPVIKLDPGFNEANFEKRKENLFTENREDGDLSRITIDSTLFQQLTDCEKSLTTFIYSNTGYRRKVIDQIDNIGGLEERTKVLLLEKSNNNPINIITKDIINLESFWLKTSQTTDTTSIEFRDPNTNIISVITSRTAMILSIYYLFKMIGIDTKKRVNKLYLTSLINPTIVNERIFENLDIIDKDGNDFYTPFINDLKLNIVPINTMTTKEELTLFINKQMTSNNKFFTYVSNVDDGLQIANMNIVLERMQEVAEIELYEGPLTKSIDDLISEEGVMIAFDNSYNYKSALSELVKIVTGVEFISKEKEIKEIEAFKSILTAFTSYTLQILVNTEKIGGVITRNEITSLYDVDIARIVTGSLKCLEDPPEVEHAYGDDGLDPITTLSGWFIDIKDIVNTEPEIRVSVDNRQEVYELTTLMRVVEI